MSRYLKSIMRTMPVVQSRQIAELLDDLRAKGEVRDAEEYKQALSDLSKLVNAEDPIPSFEQIKALVWNLCSSDAHNSMMKAATNDIEAVFLQTDEIGQRLEDQHTLVMKSMLKELEHVVNEQEDSIRRFQLIGSNNTEFRDVFLNSFGSTSLKRINRSQPDSTTLYFNNRDGKSVSEDVVPDAEVSQNGKKLLLPTLQEPRILPISVSLLSDKESYDTLINASVNNSISSIIDGTPGTFWTRTVHLKEPVNRVSTPLKFSFGNGADINYVIIQGATQYPFYVSEIWGIAPDGHKINLMLRRTNTSVDSSEETLIDNPLEEEVYVDGTVRIDFEQVFVKDVHIKFAYSSYEEGDFWIDSNVNSHKIYEEDNTLEIEDISTQINTTLLSSDLSAKLGVPKNVKQHLNDNIYYFALDNVWFGNGLYSDSAIFVSEPLLVDNPGVVSVQAKERNVGELYIGTDKELGDTASRNSLKATNAGSIEYELIRKRIGSNNDQVIDHFPVPFLGQTRVIRERFVPTKYVRENTNTEQVIKNAGCLRFCPLIKNTIFWIHDIEVYRNDELIHLGSAPNQFKVAFRLKAGTNDLDWTDNPGTDIVDFSNWDIPKQKLWIQVNNPSPTDIYTVSYSIRTSSRSEADLNLNPEQVVVYVDNNRTVRIEDDGKLVFDKDTSNEFLDRSELFLQITLRRNTASKSVSPELYEFALLVAPYG